MLKLANTLQKSLLNSTIRNVRTLAPTVNPAEQQKVQAVLPDKLYSSIEIEYRAHDKEVLKSYTTFLQQVCQHLEIAQGRHEVLPYIRWVQPALRSKFVHKKYKLHYETRTHISKLEILNVTGSTASTFLEYIERNIPEGVGMRVGFTELQPLPLTIQN
uniref:Small ribosomal subunit protein uS10m n=1 Tax=Caenorhabditis tropicalis TaxID=1561998 RepID=A0A1I7U8X8_9PELO